MWPTRRDERRTTLNEHGDEYQRQPYEPAGPPTDQLVDAIDAILSHDVPGTPPIGAITTIQKATSLPFSVGSRTVKSVSITRGKPQHGAFRSDTHIGRYEVELPLYEVDRETVTVDECPECGEQTAVFSYSAHHYIAGSESISCSSCDETHYSEEWG